MGAYLVEGGRRLYGVAQVHGAKNSVLPILAATILCPEVSVIENCPQLSDVEAAIAILRQLGCQVVQTGREIRVDARQVSCGQVPDHLMREMRSSVIFLGAILARLGEAELSFPGGCELGPRPIDLHLSAMRALGTQVEETGGMLHCTLAPGGLQGCELTLATPSVGATENAMLAACGAKGTTVINNAAREPEIVDLAQFLQGMGVNVRGAGSSVLVVEGGQKLHGCHHRVISDRIVAATLLSAVAITGGEVELRDVDCRQVAAVTAALSEAGCQIRCDKHQIHIRCNQPLRGMRPIHTAPYPGFPTDAQPPVMAALTKAKGTSIFVENIFENRYRHIDELVRMGADIRVEGRVAVICGVDCLHGATVQAADLRGGAALVVAALGADGISHITGLHHVERGYDKLEETLQELGAKIGRTWQD